MKEKNTYSSFGNYYQKKDIGKIIHKPSLEEYLKDIPIGDVIDVLGVENVQNYLRYLKINKINYGK